MAILDILTLFSPFVDAVDSMLFGSRYPFTKMSGLGNDFVIFDKRRWIELPKHYQLKDEEIRRIADRNNKTTGGCDQVIVMERSDKSDCFMRIFNADGGEVASCGNASRCVAWLLMNENGGNMATIETKAGVLKAKRAGHNRVTVDMSVPRLGWKDIPLAREFADTADLGPIFEDEHLNDPMFAGLPNPAAVSMGNPHLVLFVPFFPTELQKIGAKLEKYSALFPEGMNVGFARAVTPNLIELRVWERGAGETLACGTGACAAVVAGHRKNLLVARGEPVSVLFVGGGPDAPKDRVLHITWEQDQGGKPGHVFMEGPVEFMGKGETRV